MTLQRLCDFEAGLKGNVNPDVKLWELASRYLHVRKTWLLGSTAAGVTAAKSAACHHAPATASDLAAESGGRGTGEETAAVPAAARPADEGAAAAASTTLDDGKVVAQLVAAAAVGPPGEGGTEGANLAVGAAVRDVDGGTGGQGTGAVAGEDLNPPGAGTTPAPSAAAQTPPHGPVADPILQGNGLSGYDVDGLGGNGLEEEVADLEDVYVEGDEIVGGEGDSDDCDDTADDEEDALEIEPDITTVTSAGTSPSTETEEGQVQHVPGPLLEALEPKRFRCTCPRYWKCGICYHVVMYCALLKEDSLDQEVQRLPVVRRPGRKRNAAPCLQRQP
eukprot:GHVU01174363.1.p1 GENE.GHVU01174363.1~~GHVU01174363.1.p1  ORF type:complete len:334 (-),score=50.11 GHVU01174363.1:1339-2340(-)